MKTFLFSNRPPIYRSVSRLNRNAFAFGPTRGDLCYVYGLAIIVERWSCLCGVLFFTLCPFQFSTMRTSNVSWLQFCFYGNFFKTMLNVNFNFYVFKSWNRKWRGAPGIRLFCSSSRLRESHLHFHRPSPRQFFPTVALKGKCASSPHPLRQRLGTRQGSSSLPRPSPCWRLARRDALPIF